MGARTLAGQLALFDVRPAPAPMSVEAAAWVRTVVLARINDATYRALVEVCPCQWGWCGHCQAGKHQQCPSRRPDLAEWRTTHHVRPEDYLTGTRGYPRVPVWRATGPPCRWVCPCDVCAARPALVAA